MQVDTHPDKQTTGSTRAAHLLLVESEPLLGRFLKESLQKAGFFVHQAGDKQEAVDLLRWHPINLILLDNKIGSVEEPAFYAELRSWRDVPIIMVAPARRPEVVLAAFLSGIDDYIVKPFQLSEVKNRIQRLL